MWNGELGFCFIQLPRSTSGVKRNCVQHLASYHLGHWIWYFHQQRAFSTMLDISPVSSAERAFQNWFMMTNLSNHQMFMMKYLNNPGHQEHKRRIAIGRCGSGTMRRRSNRWQYCLNAIVRLPLSLSLPLLSEGWPSTPKGATDQEPPHD